MQGLVTLFCWQVLSCPKMHFDTGIAVGGVHLVECFEMVCVMLTIAEVNF